MTDLLHYSEEPLTRIHSVPRREQTVNAKPRGLWVSVGDEWAEWCRAEGFRLGDFNWVTRVSLAPGARVLVLSDVFALDHFTDEYASDESIVRRHSIDWRRVASEYDGIIIAPYQWERRHTLSWYYGWDVASGCIWSADAVAHVTCEPMRRPDDEERAA